MSTAKITSNLGEGRYKIIIDQDTSVIDGRLTKLSERITELETSIPKLDDEQTAAAGTLYVKVAALNSSIAAYKASGYADAERAAVQEATLEFLDAETAALTARTKLSEAKLQLLAAQKEHEKVTALKAAITTAEREAWAVDLSTELTVGSTVGIVEINGETGRINIAAAGAATAGKITPAQSMTEAQAYAGTAIKPGWQKFRPTYRTGIITAIDYETDTCSVSLDAATSSTLRPRSKDADGEITEPVGYDINQTAALTDVPIHYMTCNSSVFVVGDAVVVQFQEQDWGQPQVIGFVSNPVGCATQIQLRFAAASAYAEFTTYANARIAELGTAVDHAEYLRDTFCDEILDHIQVLEGEVKSFFKLPTGESLYQVWSQAEIDQLKAPWEEVKDSTADLIIDNLQEAIGRWETARDAGSALADSLLGTIAGCTLPANDMTDEEMGDFIVTLDCCRTEEAEPAAIDTSGWTSYQARQILSLFGLTLWDEAQDACSPDIYVRLRVPSLASFSASLKGAVDQENKLLHIIATDHTGSIDGLPEGWLETLRLVLRIDGTGETLSYPTESDYTVTSFQLPVYGTPTSATFDLRATGRLLDFPTTFGARVPSWKWRTVTINFNPVDVPYGEIVEYEDGYSFMSLYFRYVGNAFQNNLNSGIGDTYHPISFALSRAANRFYGAYNEHPITTGVDNLTVIEKEAAEMLTDLAEVNTEVNAFPYQRDSIDSDHWYFLTGTAAGDCEDYSITKIQKLLERGWSIDNLRLESGFREISYVPPRYYDDGSEIRAFDGHMWVLADVGGTKYALTNGNNSLFDPATLRALYPYAPHVQISGRTWAPYDLPAWTPDMERAVTVEPLPHTSFDLPIIRMTGSMLNTTPEVPAS
jgi:hypothetical protein